MVAQKGGSDAAAAASRRRRLWLRPERIAHPALRIGAALLLVLAMMMGGGFAVIAGAPSDRVELELGDPSVFYAVPEMVTALESGAAARQRYVRLSLVLEVAASDAELVEAGEPAILDAVQEHLRTLRPADLAGEAGTHRLRQAVRAIVDKRVRPSELRGVLFTQLLVG